MRYALSFLLLPVLLFTNAFAQAEDSVIWVDVRSSLEHSIDHIEGDIRITHTDIVEEVKAKYPDLSTEIRLYCRSGGRAGKAMTALNEAGYQNVKNIGSIEDARKARIKTE